MRQGNFSEISTADQESVHRTDLSGQHHPAVDAVAGLVEPAAVLPGGERAPARPATWRRQASNKDNIDQFLGRVDQNIGNKIRLYVRYNWHDSLNTSIGAIPATGVTQPRVNKNTLVHLHPHAEAKPLQRFSDRLPPARLRHAESVLRQRSARLPERRSASPASTATRDTAIPAFRASTSARSAAWRPVERTGISSTRPSRHRTSWPGTAARTTCVRDSICAGWRPAGERPTIRAACSTSPVI